MKKAIFFDVDGTLVSFNTHCISPAVLQALHILREKGHKVIVATGRHPGMLDYMRAVFPFDAWITLSGQYCYCGDTVLHSNPMSRQAVEELVTAVKKNNVSCIFLEGTQMYINHADEGALQFLADHDLPMPPKCDPARALEGELYQGITFLNKENEHLLLDTGAHIKTTRWHPNFLDVIPTTGGKDKGMDAVLAHFGIALEDSMAFGDGENDLSMILHAGIGVAMGSASEEMKAQADYVTGTVDEDGVVSALEHFGLL